MDYIVKEILTGELIPVLLGLSPEAVETARRMYRKYGVVSHVFCRDLPLFRRFSLCMRFHRIRHAEGRDRLMVTAVRDFARQVEGADVICYLIPCTEEAANLIWRNREELEDQYVIANLKEMNEVWFGQSGGTESEAEEGKEAAQ